MTEPGGGQDWHEMCMLPGEVVRRGIFLRKARKVCVCVCFECHDALHVGNFLVSCIPIGSSLRRLRQV